ncbi:Ig-like domain-containing protein [Methanobrevibacter olleyae]|uniref:Adhesin-like protein n=1 Tax=Methanobrevibacter olleyae TaxID=294671 RepID=A0A126QXQ1_METOL|nr:Ig-like domain repeat protein [Methanobrevibacter olleyae]AMK14584.1 adhesin-like protein [Methanobrevibacter olleyae]SFL27643.1 parallel beta-helix repeat (two copies) [Methanobrevibacter olleyae]
MNKKIILPLFLVLLVAISVSAVSAEATDEAIVADAGADETIANAGADETVADTGVDEAVEESADNPILAEGTDKNGTDIQDKIDNAEDGGEVDLGENQVYNVENQVFNLTKKLIIKGNNVTIKASGAAQGGVGALFIANVAGTEFKGITFKNTDGPKQYGETISGYAIQLAIENGTVDNCKFIDWSSGVYGRGASFCTIKNSYFNGSSTKVTNGGTKESGTKAINLMGSHDITITGCTFDGQVLDGISIASNSGNNIITDNTFIENCYAIYFGGASTQGCVIANNTFTRCGYCKDENGNIIFKNLPVLSTQKAANGYIVADNTIEAGEGSIFLKAESGNTAHGYPSSIGDINITGNTLTVAAGANAESITFIYILTNKGELNPYAPINISGNNIVAGVTPLTVWYADWGSESDPVIPAADSVATSINIKEISTATKKVTIQLVDVNGEAQAGKEISYSINGGAIKTAETDADGLLTIDVTEDGIVALAFAGDEKLKPTETSINFVATVTKTTPTITASAMTTTAKIGKYYTVTLKDSTGKALVGQTVTFIFNGKSTNVKTYERGIAKININLATKGNYPITISYLGNDNNNAVVAVKNIKVNAQATKAVFKAKTFKAKATKKVSFTLKDASGKAIKAKKITFKVKGKTYTAKTNAKGIATVKVKLTKKGKYTITAKFAGDNTYKAISKKAKITIKK